MKNSVAVYYGVYYRFEEKTYGWPPEVFFLKGLCFKFEKVVLLAPVKTIEKLTDIDPMFIEIEQHERLFIKELPFFDSRLSSLLVYMKLNSLLKNVNVEYAFIAQVMFNAMKIASILKSKKIKIRIYIASNPLEILNSKELSGRYFFNAIGRMYVKYLFFQTNKYKCFINGQNLFEKIDVKYKNIINSSTLFENDRVEENTFSTDLSLLFVGRLVASKKVDVLIKSIAKLKENYPNVILNIVGLGPLLHDLKIISQKLNLNDNIRFLGGISSKKELYELYQNSYLFIFSSLSEGNPRVIKEATFFNLPSVSTRVGNLENEYQNDKDIAFFDFNNDLQLASKVCELYENKQKYSMFKLNLKKHKVVTIEDFVGIVYDKFNKDTL